MKAFNTVQLHERLKGLENAQPIKPEKFEPIWSITHLFETGVEITIKWVIKNGEKLYFEINEKKVF